MLPKGVLGRKMLSNLKVYAGTEHGHQAQKPVEYKIRYTK
jgi:large subunit ribosomal protein L13